MRDSTTGSAGGPKIVFAHEGKWTEVHGHWCFTLEAAEAYASEFGMQVVYDGEELPPCPPPEPKRTLSHNLNPESVKMILDALAENPRTK